MKTIVKLGLMLLSLNAVAAFRLGGELVNPRTTPHTLGGSGVVVEIPDDWTVQNTPREIAASDIVISDSEVRNSQIRLVAGATAHNVDVNNCESESSNDVVKVACDLGRHQGVVYLIRGSQTLATLEYVQGNLANSKVELNKVLRSLSASE